MDDKVLLALVFATVFATLGVCYCLYTKVCVTARDAERHDPPDTVQKMEIAEPVRDVMLELARDIMGEEKSEEKQEQGSDDDDDARRQQQPSNAKLLDSVLSDVGATTRAADSDAERDEEHRLVQQAYDANARQGHRSTRDARSFVSRGGGDVETGATTTPKDHAARGGARGSARREGGDHDAGWRGGASKYDASNGADGRLAELLAEFEETHDALLQSSRDPLSRRARTDRSSSGGGGRSTAAGALAAAIGGGGGVATAVNNWSVSRPRSATVPIVVVFAVTRRRSSDHRRS